jgi:hypothetical protein
MQNTVFLEEGGGAPNSGGLEAPSLCKLWVSHNKMYNSKLICVMQKCNGECISKFHRRT